MPLTLVAPRKGRSQNYRIRGTVRGTTIDESTGTADRAIAEAIRIRRENQLLEESVFGARTSCRFSEVAVMYLGQVKPGRSQVEAIIGNTRRDGSVSPCLLGDFGDTMVCDIDQASVDRVISKRFGELSPATVQRSLLTPLIAVLSFAAKRKWCDRPQFDRPKAPKGRSRWATYDEADRLLTAASPHIYRIALFLMLTGARMSEALELEWADVNLAERWITFRDTKRKGEDRGVPLHPQLVALLANLRQRDGRVFLSDDGLPYSERAGGGHIKTAWLGACRRAEIEGLRPHDLRHTCSTWLTMAGVHEQVRDEILGHKSSDMGRRYSHIPRPDLLRAIDLLPDRIAYRRPIRGKSVEQTIQQPSKRKA